MKITTANDLKRKISEAVQGVLKDSEFVFENDGDMVYENLVRHIIFDILENFESAVNELKYLKDKNLEDSMYFTEGKIIALDVIINNIKNMREIRHIYDDVVEKDFEHMKEIK